MPNGKPGDHPLTDQFVHGLHPFPADIESLLWEIRDTDPSALKAIENELLRWQADKTYALARRTLRELLDRTKSNSAHRR